MDTRIIHLLARKLSGEATEEEKAELDQLLTRNPEAVYYAELIIQLWDDEKMRSPTSTDVAYLKHLARHRPTFNISLPGPIPPAAPGGPTPGVPTSASPSSATPSSASSPQSAQAPPGDDHPITPGSNRPIHTHRIRRTLAAICAILVLAAGLYQLTRSGAHPAPALARIKTIECSAGPGDRRSIVLPDGSRVRLNAGSILRYDSDMLRKDTRDVSLSGEAYFDVGKDKQHCFIIHTDKIAIKVLGTAFNVRAYPADKITETTLMHGSIELTVNNKPYQKIILKPREKFALIDDTAQTLSNKNPSAAPAAIPAAPSHAKEKLVIQDVVPIEVADKEYVKEVSWVEDNFVFQNETLDELAPKMERWFNVDIRIDNRQIKAFHFTGIFHKESITEALQAMQLIKPFKFTITDNHVFIR